MKLTTLTLSCCFALLNLPVAFTQVRLPRLIRDSMVLQRDVPVKLWGWANKNEKVKIAFNNKAYKTVADTNGKWNMMLPATKAGGPYNITITASNSITLKDVLFGDVWICSGQSNMVHQMGLHSVRYADEIADANNSEIRHFWIPTLTDLQKPHDDLPSGYWKSANPQDILQFSAVAYFFAKKIYEQYHVPIGLINASVGGTPIEAWISEEGLKNFSSIRNIIQKNKDTAYINSFSKRVFNTMPGTKQEDKGLLNKWYDVNYVPKGWHTITVPGYWEDQGIKDLDGIVWYRKEFEVPESMVNVPAKLFLGRIVDADVVYINGTMVGNTTYMYPQRRYAIPSTLLHEGKNLIVVKVQNNAGKGGFVPDKPYYLFAGKDTIDLKGYWQYKIGEVYVPFRGFSGGGIAAQNQPTALYNAMLAPVAGYTCKGFLWYQGESNTGKPLEYDKLQTALINNWRDQWNMPAAPFLFVQLPGFMDMNYLPSESQWAQFRQSQFKTLAVPNTGMAVAIDLGEWNDIHPDRKKEVGERLALWARKVAYHENDIVYSGPLYQSSTLDGNKIILSFTNTGSGLVSNDGEPLYYFAIAGEDKKFVWANAKIEDNKVIVWNDTTNNPKYVRYAWADNPDGANLYNKEGLPASPFTTEQ
jgi:sialate O-acetylesterase